MFAKLKKQVKEKSSSTDISTSIAGGEDGIVSVDRKLSTDNNNSNATAANNNNKSSRGRVKSNTSTTVSDENHSNQSSDEASSTTTTDTNTNAMTTLTTNAAVGANAAASSNDKMTSNKEENSYKYQLQQLNQSLLNQIDLLANELKEKLKENEDLRASTLILKSQIDEYENEIRVLKNDKDELIIRNAELSEKYELLKHVNSKQQQLEHQQHQQNHNMESHQHQHLNQDALNHSIKTRTHSDSATLKQGVGDDTVSSNIPSVAPSSTPPNNNNNAAAVAAAAADEVVKSLRDELTEKNKVIKNLQQRLNDLKKTLQKELKYQQLPNETTLGPNTNTTHNNNAAAKNSNNTNANMSADEAMQIGAVRSARVSVTSASGLPPSPSPLSLPPHPNGYATDTATTTSKPTNALKKPSIPVTSTASCTDFMLNGMITKSNKIEDINNKYLKHVILKFLTSREYEALHLVKAISVLLNLTSDEEKALRESLEWKMSWFGTKPKLTNIT